VHQIPTLTKIVVNCGVGEAVKQPKLLDVVVEELALITGQKPVRARRRSRSPTSASARGRRSARR
jgi:large subunit ribosomal protein L5